MKMMTRILKTAMVTTLSGVCMASMAYATPSTTYWTTATSDVQPFNVWHIGVDNYFRLYQTQSETDNGLGASLPTDVGLTVGALPYEKLNLEVGVDYLAPARFAHPTLRS